MAGFGRCMAKTGRCDVALDPGGGAATGEAGRRVGKTRIIR
jgi:hypothetical protein